MEINGKINDFPLAHPTNKHYNIRCNTILFNVFARGALAEMDIFISNPHYLNRVIPA